MTFKILVAVLALGPAALLVGCALWAVPAACIPPARRLPGKLGRVGRAMTNSSPEGRQEAAVLDAKALEAARAAYRKAEEAPNLISCPTCGGRGHANGDWCDRCGGGGYDLADGEENRPLDEAIAAYLSTLVAPVAAVEVVESKPYEWIWWGQDATGKEHISLGRWQSHACQHRYKYAIPQATEHDHPKATTALTASEIEAALIPAKPAVEVVEALAKALRESDAWVMAALECKDWHWDADQRECAELSVKQAHAALAALQAPATPDAQTEVEK